MRSDPVSSSPATSTRTDATSPPTTAFGRGLGEVGRDHRGLRRSRDADQHEEGAVDEQEQDRAADPRFGAEHGKGRSPHDCVDPASVRAALATSHGTFVWVRSAIRVSARTHHPPQAIRSRPRYGRRTSGTDDAAVGLLVRLEDGRDDAREREAGPVERVDELRPSRRAPAGSGSPSGAPGSR